MSGSTTTSVTHTVRVSGMTCASCERRVSRALRRLPGVEAVSASAARGRVTITGTLPDARALTAALAPSGYTLGAPAWVSRDPRVWRTAAAGALAVTAVGVAAVGCGLTGWSPAAGLGGPLLALLVGLAAGVSTCMALVGGLVLGVSAASSGAGRGAARPQLLFTAGRWTSFALGGALLGAVGSAARLPDGALAAGMLVAAAVMLVLGVRLTGVSPRVSGWSLTLPRSWSGRFGLAGDRGAAVAGAATFLLPCGFTQAMQLYAISRGAALPAAVVMLAFAVGTTPGLLGLGLLGGLSARRAAGATPGTPRAAAAWPRLIGVVVLAFALVTGLGGLRATGVGVPGWPQGGSAPPTTVSANVTMDGAEQVVTMTQSAGGYSPARTVVWAGVPIRWTISSGGGFTCSAALRVPSLHVAVDLTQGGVRVVRLPALAVGTTRFNCAMGMYTGTLEAIRRA